MSENFKVADFKEEVKAMILVERVMVLMVIQKRVEGHL